MKLIHLFLTIFLSTATLAISAESVPLWPEGKTPYTKPVDKETGSPLFQPYLTKGADKHNGAAIVVCPGGGYGGLAKDHEGRQIALWLNKRGVSAYVLQYRLGSKGHHYPTQLADVQRAIRLARSRAADDGIDAKRIGVMGFSAGGHLASMAATLYDEEAYPASDDVDKVSARPDFAVLCYPVINMVDKGIAHGGSRNNLLGPDNARDDEKAKHVSSDLNVDENTPPTFLFHTQEDAAVPVENSIRFFSAMNSHGISGEMHIFQKGPHGVGLYLGDPVLRHWSQLLDLWLKNNSFYSGPKKKTAMKGKVHLDGEVVSWGSLSFYPEDESSPVTTIRVRRGNFSAKEEDGPVLGKSRLVFEGSIWEETGSEKDRVIQLEKKSPSDTETVTLDIQAEHPPLELHYSSR